MEYRVSVGSLVVGKIVSNDTNDDAVQNEDKESDYQMNADGKLWDCHSITWHEVVSWHF